MKFKQHDIFDPADLEPKDVKELLATGFKYDWEEGATTYIGDQQPIHTPAEEGALLYHPDHWQPVDESNDSPDYWYYEHAFKAKSKQARRAVETDGEDE